MPFLVYLKKNYEHIFEGISLDKEAATRGVL